MIQPQSNSLRSYRAVTVVLTTHQATWSAHVGFTKAVTRFNAILGDIGTQAQIQLESELASEEKLALRKALGEAAYEVSAAIHAYAVEVEDLGLEARVDYSRSAIVLGKEDQVLSRCRAIHTLATEQLANLADNGITVAKLAGLQQRIEAFEAVQPMPRNRVNRGRAATQTLATLFRAANTVLRKRMDKLVPQFAAANPTFVKEYQAARVIVDVHGPAKAKDTPTPVPQPA